VKEKVLGVESSIIKMDGAVSEKVVRQMAENIRGIMGANIGIATSGYAGPEGGNEIYPVGSIWIAIASENGTNTKLLRLGNRRLDNIKQSSIVCLGRLLKEIQ
jgi:nicotinamide-nucleotide amidase